IERRSSPVASGPLGSAADDRLGEADDASVAEALLHRLLLAEDPLLGEHALGVPGVDPTLDDLRDRLLGLALLAGEVLEADAGLLDEVGVDLVAAQRSGLGEGDVERDLVGL